jgi:hypothetical protein
MPKSIEEVYWIVDEVVKSAKIGKVSRPGRKPKMSPSEVVTLLVMGHLEGLTTTKQLHNLMFFRYRFCFKSIPSYAQFSRLVRSNEPTLRCLIKLFCSIYARKRASYYIIDSTSLPVAGYDTDKVKWIGDQGGIGKNMHGWYHGFKLHIIVNHDLEIVSATLTPANVHDLTPLKQMSFIENIKGILVGDKGYQSAKVRTFLASCGVELLAKQRENMDPFLNVYFKRFFTARRRIEGIFGYLKTKLAAIYRYARSAEGFLSQVQAAVLSYMLKNFSEADLPLEMPV